MHRQSTIVQQLLQQGMSGIAMRLQTKRVCLLLWMMLLTSCCGLCLCTLPPPNPNVNIPSPEKRKEISEVKNTFYDVLASESQCFKALRAEKELLDDVAVQEKAKDRLDYFAKHGLVTPNFRKYQQHFARVLPIAAPQLFQQDPENRKQFLDLGSAPGGMSAFLCEQLHWSGQAVSLAESQGGFEMMFRDARLLNFSGLDMSTPDAWKELLSLTHGNRFDFINLGVTPMFKPITNEFLLPDSTWQTGIPLSHALRLLGWFAVMRNELLCALHALKPQGCMMVVLPKSYDPCTFFFLDYLLNCTDSPPHFIPSPAPEKNPVYLLIQNVKVDSEGYSSLLSFLLNTAVSVENCGEDWTHHTWEESRPVFLRYRAVMEAQWRVQTSAMKRALMRTRFMYKDASRTLNYAQKDLERGVLR